MLRPYQEELIAKARAHLSRGIKSVLIQAPTGAGKTLLTAYILKRAAERGHVSWFIVHRRELVKQSSEAFRMVGLDHGIAAAGFPEDKRPLVQIASVQTISRRYGRYRKPSLIVLDEAHHVAASSWSKFYSVFPEAAKIGLSATPNRLDGKGLGRYFMELVIGPSVSSLIEQGYLSRYRVFAPSTIDTTGLRSRAGDFAKEELSKAADKATITGSALEHYQRLANGKRALVFCVSIEHSKHVVAQFNAAGISAAHVDGETNQWERDYAIERFKAGELKILSNCDLFGEGFDAPAVEAVILLRPTQSLALHLQQIGRALRPFEGKTHATILDHAGNTFRHGLPDEDRVWSLMGSQGNRKSAEGDSPRARLCPTCFAAQAPSASVCLYCQTPFAAQAREIKEVEGELEEIDARAIQLARKKEQTSAQTLEELTALGRARGYKSPERWSQYIWDAREAKRRARGKS